jgi:hypothetical protein
MRCKRWKTTMAILSGENRKRSSGARTGRKRLATTSTSYKAAIVVIIQTTRTARTTKSHGQQSSGSCPQHLPTRL